MKYVLVLMLSLSFSISALAKKSKKEKAEKTTAAATSTETKPTAVCKTDTTTDDQPSALFPIVRKCVSDKKYNDAVQTYMLTMAFGVFDTKRVTDKVAHQGLNILHAEMMSQFTKEEKEKFLADLKKLGDDKNEMKKTCDRIKKIGYPKYRPEYMLKISVNNSAKSSADEFVKGFDAEKEWKEVLKTFMTCG